MDELTNHIPENIFRNAIIAIELGIEDYLQGNQDPRRFYSSLRNLYCGLLLLLKTKLAEISKDDNSILITPNVEITNVSGKVSWEKNEKKCHFKTVDYKTLRKRLDVIGIKVDWQIIEDLKTYRDNIEHYFVDDLINRKKVIGEHIAKSFLLIRDFCVDHLHKHPQDEFSEIVWNAFISNESIYGKELEDRNKKFDSLHWFIDELRDLVDSFHCTQCGSNIVTIIDPPPNSRNAKDAVFVCRTCGETYTYKKLMLEYAGAMCQGRMLICDGVAYDPIDLCPECGEPTYDTVMDICYSCGAEIGNPLPNNRFHNDDDNE